MKFLCVLCFLASIWKIEADGFEFLNKIYEQCHKQVNPVKCLKVQVLKVAQRAERLPVIGLTDSINLVQTDELNATNSILPLDKLSSDKLDELLVETTDRFLTTHKLQVSVPDLIEEARGKKKKGSMLPLLLAGIGVKGIFLSMAYKGIAMMAGTAILIGKIALIMSAILGLKLLVHHDHSQVIEIVKHPHHSHKHSSHSDDHSYKNLGSAEEMAMEDKNYKAPIPYQYYATAKY